MCSVVGVLHLLANIIINFSLNNSKDKRQFGLQNHEFIPRVNHALCLNTVCLHK